MTLTGRHILVLGGGGFIGRHTVNALLAEGAAVRVIDLHKPADADPRIDWRCSSLAATEDLASTAQGCDTAIYLAGHSLPATGNQDIAGEISDHVIATVRTAEICAEQGVSRFVFSSSGGTVYGTDNTAPIAETAPTKPMTAYGASKLAIEHYLRIVSAHRPMRAISLRIANPYGEGQRAGRGQGFVAAAMAAAFSGDALSIWGTGEVVRDFVHVADVAQACLRACTYSGAHDLFNIGKGEGASLLEIVRQVEIASGRKINLRLCPERAIDVKRNVLDIARARSELGWSPAIALDAGLRRTADWWAEQDRS